MIKDVTIHINNRDGIDLDSGMLEFAMRVAARYAPQAHVINIYPAKRIPDDAPAWQFPGRLEWLEIVHYRDGGPLTIGLLQRSKDAEFESNT